MVFSERVTIQVSLAKTFDDTFIDFPEEMSEFVDALSEVNGRLGPQGFTLIGSDEKELSRNLFTLKARFPSLNIIQAILIPSGAARPRKLI